MSQVMPTNSKWSRFFDGHTHLPINKAQQPDQMIINGTHIEELPNLRNLLKDSKYSVGFGIHPWFISESSFIPPKEIYSEFDFVGEIGLDRSFKHRETYHVQLKTVQQQLNIASELQKNVCFHLVKAYGAAYDLFRNYDRSVYLHGYRGSVEFAHSLLKKPFFFGFSAEQLKTLKGYNVAKFLPMNRIILESDSSPCLMLIKEAYLLLSQIKQCSFEEIHRHQNENIIHWMNYLRSD